MSFIDRLPEDKYALHDIRFRFKVDNTSTVISTNHPELTPNEISKDISFEPIITHDLTIKTTVHVSKYRSIHLISQSRKGI
ncbi:MAG TPA: hypothetical protein VH500_17945 [Nitrososphaeraceae archaeon]